MPELNNFLRRYREKTNGVKADVVFRTLAIFYCAKNFSKAPKDIDDESPLICHEKDYTYDAIHQECLHLPWISDLHGTPPFTFLQLYEYLVIRTSKFKHILLKSNSYKKLNAFQLFMKNSLRKLKLQQMKHSRFLMFTLKLQ